jgi:hypothetical protein
MYLDFKLIEHFLKLFSIKFKKPISLHCLSHSSTSLGSALGIIPGSDKAVLNSEEMTKRKSAPAIIGMKMLTWPVK